MTQIYVCFIKDNRTGIDFTSVTRGATNAHKHVKEQMARKYAGSQYTVLTTLTTTELNGMLDDINRWCAVTSSSVASTRTTQPYDRLQ